MDDIKIISIAFVLRPYEPDVRRGRFSKTRTILERLVDLSEPNDSGCWIFNGHRIWNGYGEIKIAGKKLCAHRVSFEVFNGPIPNGLILDHICHDPLICRLGILCPHRPCINPDHLKLSNHRENSSPERRWNGKKPKCENHDCEVLV